MRMLALLGLFVSAQDPSVELVYRLKFPEDFKGDRTATAARALEVVRKRLAALHPGTSAKAGEGEKLVVTASLEKATSVKKTVARPGTLSFLKTAEREVQADFAKTGKVPAGFKAWTFQNVRDKDYEAWAGGKVLLAEEPVVDQRQVVRAEEKQDLLPGGVNWSVAIEMNEEGARRFDAAAKELYHRRPRGRIAIVVDGEIRSMPILMAEAFGGYGVITGQKGKEDAEALARLLTLGELPVPLALEAERIPGK